MVPSACLQCVIVVVPDHTHLLLNPGFQCTMFFLSTENQLR